MINARYLGRLGLHGAKFVGKMGAIVAGVAVASVWEMIKAGPPTVGVPDHAGPIVSYGDAQDAFSKGQISIGEMAYYRDMYEEEAG